MGLGRWIHRWALVAVLVVGIGCEEDEQPGDASEDGDAMIAVPTEGGLDASEDAAVATDGSAMDASEDAAREAGPQPHDAATDASSPDDSGSEASVPDASVPAQTTHVYVGGHSTEIAHFVLDRETGELRHRGATKAGNAPTYLAIHPARDALYAINEQSTAAASQVIAFAIDAGDGSLTRINAVPSGGEGARHVAVHPTGGWIAVAHHGSGHTTILPVRDDRGLGGVIDVERGPGDAARQAHQAVFDARGTALLVPCIQNNYVLQYQFSSGALALNVPASVAVAGGPRHLALHPDQMSAYVLSEASSILTWHGYDGTTGQLGSPMTFSTAQATAGGSSHVAIDPSGRSLFVSNEEENSIAVFAVAPGGQPQLVEHETGGLATPRDFAIDPQGQHLIVANHAGAQDLRVYRIDPASGSLTFLSSANVGGQPSSVAIALLP